ncbi:MAG: lipocalin-like domain-containing protein, partial [Gammaproteobacteria bacterium]
PFFSPTFFCLLVSLLILFASADADYWRFADSSYQLDFKRDHANHPDYRMERWSYTGNLSAKDGRRFGYQLKFIRLGLTFKPENPSRWAVRDLFVAQMAVTDVTSERFHHAERINRAGVGWAGAEADRFRVWNEDWEATTGEADRHLLRATDSGIGLELELDRGKAPVVHGERGFVQKGEFSANASHSYSLTRMPARGAVVINGERIVVEGQSWMDHEFGASLEEKEQAGWDRVSIQLDDGTDLMLYRFRRTDGARDVHSLGTMIFADGSVVPIRFDQFDLEPREQWASKHSGANYPIGWRVKLPSRQVELNVRAVIAGQELRASQTIGVTWWEGAIEITGIHRGRTVRGRGHLEMAGYAGAAMVTLSE